MVTQKMENATGLAKNFGYFPEKVGWLS